MLNERDRELFFRVIRLALEGKALPEGVTVPTAVVEALERHAMLGVVADTIADNAAQDVQQHIYAHMAALMRKECRQKECIVRIVTALESKGIKAVLLKGLGLATLYPGNCMRAVGDVDVFVGRENYSEAMRVIGDICGVPDIDTKIPGTSIHGSVDMGEVHIEVHHMAADTAIRSIRKEYNGEAEKRLLASERYIMISGKRVCVPPSPYDVVYVFEHLLKHLRYEGVGIRQFVDWLMVLRCNGDYDAGELKRLLVRFHLLDAWQVLGGILVWQLGLPEDMFPFWNGKKARYSQCRNLRFILDAENLGHGTAIAKGYYFMQPSLKRKLLAARYYLPLIFLDYHLFPHDSLRRLIERIFSK